MPVTALQIPIGHVLICDMLQLTPEQCRGKLWIHLHVDIF